MDKFGKFYFYVIGNFVVIAHNIKSPPGRILSGGGFILSVFSLI